jgi:hypothetical protein
MSFTQLRCEHAFDHTLVAQNRSRSELGVASAQPILTCQFDLAHSDSEKHWMWGLLHHSVTMFAGDRHMTETDFGAPRRMLTPATTWANEPVSGFGIANGNPPLL